MTKGRAVKSVSELRKGVMAGNDVILGEVLFPNSMARRMPLFIMCEWFDFVDGFGNGARLVDPSFDRVNFDIIDGE